jgi:hypothetical protein
VLGGGRPQGNANQPTFDFRDLDVVQAISDEIEEDLVGEFRKRSETVQYTRCEEWRREPLPRGRGGFEGFKPSMRKIKDCVRPLGQST